ncbi:glucose-1-phosphate adenylyltransferase [Reinekea thalattae]|uniref:glucose-1-phosphate adenylyltransferase n=1 Tax=Reinekea thalattae TaxID=2593301 RepID=UPI001C9D4846|nr:glucose-1-phosphate adenylyltransferase [Reinekea thalattae]
MQRADRFISNLTKDTYALILAGGRGSRLHELTAWRAKPAVYFGGKYRIVDFPLSNCINSGIRRIGVATQYKSHSLIRHIQRGWGHFKADTSEFVDILPASQRVGDDWYIGTADAVRQNLDIIRTENTRYVLILSGDHVYRMDYGLMIADHVASGADMTISCLETSVQEAANNFGVVCIDGDNQVTDFEEKPSQPKPLPDNAERCLASMGNYVFSTEFLFEQLERDSVDSLSSHDFGNDIIPSIIKNHRVAAHIFKDPNSNTQPYWQDIGTLDAFWQANMELVSPTPSLNLYDKEWPIWTFQEQLPPAKFVFNDDSRRGMAVDSAVSGGCIISGASVVNSLLYSNVHLHSHSYVEHSVLLPDVDVAEHCRLNRVIIDSRCRIPQGMAIGYDQELDRSRGFRITDQGITLVTKDMLAKL